MKSKFGLLDCQESDARIEWHVSLVKNSYQGKRLNKETELQISRNDLTTFRPSEYQRKKISEIVFNFSFPIQVGKYSITHFERNWACNYGEKKVFTLGRNIIVIKFWKHWIVKIVMLSFHYVLPIENAFKSLEFQLKPRKGNRDSSKREIWMWMSRWTIVEIIS